MYLSEVTKYLYFVTFHHCRQTQTHVHAHTQLCN